jgi:hypothetical protein
MRKTKATQSKPGKKEDDFESVAKRLGCDPDLKKFDAQLRKIAKKPKPPKSRKAHPL